MVQHCILYLAFAKGFYSIYLVTCYTRVMGRELTDELASKKKKKNQQRCDTIPSVFASAIKAS